MAFDLEIMKGIQSFRSGFADGFFRLITLLGNDIVAFLVICLVFWCLDRRQGEFLIFSLFLSFSFNNILKDIVKRPRPIGQEGIYTDPGAMEEVMISGNPDYAYSWSFPSGHAQASGTLLTSLAILIKRWWVTILFALLLLLIMVSRPYMGVHYPSDVVCGAIFGIGFSFLAAFLLKRFYAHRKWMYLGIAVLLLPMLFWCTNDTAKALGGFMGFALAFPLEERFVRFKTDGAWWKRILRLLLGGGLLMGIRYLTKYLFPEYILFDYLRYFLLVFFAYAGYPFLFQKLKL